MAIDTTRYLAEHTVVSGDSLSAIAKRYYGSGDQAHWMLIYNENRNVIGPDPARIQVGQKLLIPRPDTNVTVIANHTVVTGDTLRKISEKYYGSPDGWASIYEMNKALIGSDPNLLRPGQVLKIPWVEGPYPDPGDQTGNGEFIAIHTVAAGETLSAIAKRYYGSAEVKYWKPIHRANKDVIGKDYTKIFPGQKLKIPKL